MHLPSKQRWMPRCLDAPMCGGYRRLAQLPPIPLHEEGVLHPQQNVSEQELWLS